MRLSSLLALAPLLAAVSTGCASQRAATPADAPVADTAPTSAASASAHDKALPFIENDFSKALATAREKKVPVFVDAWAPWCHTCRYMNAYVFTDASLKPHADRFVWLSLDTENAANSAFLEKYDVTALPTMFIIDPSSEQVALKWVGSANAGQLEKLLEDAERAVKQSGANPAEEALVRADRLNGEGKAAEAAKEYREALRLGAVDWPRRSRTVESLVGALQQAGDIEGCAQLARSEAPTLPKGPSYANVIGWGLSCASVAPKEAAWRAETIAALEPLAVESLKIEGLLADDRSGIYLLLAELRDERGDAAGAKTIAGEWLTFLEKEAEKAPNPDARSVFDPHRLSAALVLGDPARVVPALQRSEKDLPKDYNPAARLAIAYRELGRYDEALAASDRALARIEGPRRIRVLEVKSSIYDKKGDKAAAKRTLEEALSYARSLPAGQRSEGTIQRVERQIASVK